MTSFLNRPPLQSLRLPRCRGAFPAVCFWLILCAGPAAAAAAPAGDDAALTISIDRTRPGATLTSGLWGTNLLFWIDNDAALATGRPVEALRRLHIGLLRFPGGTVAQNYDWRTNRLMNPARWPQKGDGAPATDTDEFIAVCRAVGAEPMMVVNTEAWVLRGDLAAGAREAAAWVRYCNIEHDYHVRYWEIGNENYFHLTQNAREYAACVKLYAAAMKAVDPSIRIALNGPWSTEIFGEGDISPPPVRAVLLDYERRITSESQTRVLDSAREDLKRHPNQSTGADSEAVRRILADYASHASTPGQLALLAAARAALARDPAPGITWARPWWETVVPLAGADADIVTIHVYYPHSRIPAIVDQFNRIQALFRAAHPGRDWLWLYSEFNDIDRDTSEAARAIENMELWLRLTAAGMDLACQWPFRWDEDRYPPLLDRATNQPRPHFHTLQAISEHLRGRLVATTSADAAIPAFTAVDGTHVATALFATRLKKNRTITLTGFGPSHALPAAFALVPDSNGTTLDRRPLVCKTAGNDTITLDLPAGCLAVIESQP